MRTDVTIRRAKKADVPGILPIWTELMDLHAQLDPLYTRRDGASKAFAAFITMNIDKDDWQVFVAEADGLIVGHLQCCIKEYPPVLTTSEYGHIIDAAVTSAYRGQGIGGKLVSAALEWFQAKGIARIEVRMSVHNKTSTAFWHAMGFVPYLETACMQLGPGNPPS